MMRMTTASTSDNLKSRVTAALAEHVGPALEMDGTLLEVLDVTDGVARIRLGSVCGNCPSSIMLVVNGIEEELRKHIPEIAYIEAVP
jgi:Fe-S cluster biogenesis protein NfuA